MGRLKPSRPSLKSSVDTEGGGKGDLSLLSAEEEAPDRIKPRASISIKDCPTQRPGSPVIRIRNGEDPRQALLCGHDEK